MIDVNKLKVGVTFAEDEQPWKVLKYDFTKMGRGNATIKVKARNLLTGSIVTKSYLSGNMVEGITLDKKHMQYLYKDDEKLYFMDPVTFEQCEIDREVVGSDINYLIEGEKAWVLFWEEKILGVEVAASVIMKVVDTEATVKGNTVNNALKSAVLESGLKVIVPMFINIGDSVKINTETDSYIGRAN